MSLFGMGLPMASVSLIVWAEDLCGDNGYDAAVKWFTVAYAAGSFLFSSLPGIIADQTGSYVPVYLLFLLLAATCIFLVQRVILRSIISVLHFFVNIPRDRRPYHGSYPFLKNT
ncbi:MAG: hypothetical protein AAGU32_05380 [Bacillota bacterium]